MSRGGSLAASCPPCRRKRIFLQAPARPAWCQKRHRSAVWPHASRVPRPRPSTRWRVGGLRTSIDAGRFTGRHPARMLIEDFDKTRRIALRRNIHRAGCVGARDHHKGTSLYPSPAMRINVVDNLCNLAWEVLAEDRLDL